MSFWDYTKMSEAEKLEEILKKYVWYNAELYAGRGESVVTVKDALKAMAEAAALKWDEAMKHHEQMLINRNNGL